MRAIAFFLMICLGFLSSFAAAYAASPESPSSSVSITPDEARRAIEILQSDALRAEALRSLKAIADSAPSTHTGLRVGAGDAAQQTNGASPSAASLASAALAPSAPSASSTSSASSASTPASSASPTSPASATPAPTSTIVPLEANGLSARALRRFDLWIDNLWSRLGEMASAARSVPAFVAQSSGSLNAPATRLVLRHVLEALLAAFAAGLAVEWLLSRALRRPRHALVTYAERLDARVKHADASFSSLAAAKPRPQTQTIERDGAASSAAAHPYWRVLRHLPYALAALVLNLLPLVAFFVAAGLTLRGLAANDGPVHDSVAGFLEAYLITRVALAILHLLVSPAGRGLRVLNIRDTVAAILKGWIRYIIALAAFGLAAGDAIQSLGAEPAMRLALLKAVSFIVHVCVVILIFRLRRPMMKVIEGQKTGRLADARHWLARIWATVASILVMGVWVVWALGVEDGFPKLIHFTLISLGVIVVARVAAILALGSIARFFHLAQDDAHNVEIELDAQTQTGTQTQLPNQTETNTGTLRRLASRYYTLVCGAVSTIITFCACVTLLQVWGLDAFDWFAPDTLGGNLVSAIATIAVSIVVAVLVWETANLRVERRLALWNERGDTMRIARLRTLLPMLRTGLFVIVAVVVGLTALNAIGVNTTPLLAGASIVGVAVGFGSQKLVQDFITGIFLLLENAMQVGDSVTVAGVSGTVEYLSIRTVRLRGSDGSLYIVPFSSVSTVNNTNRGLGNAALRVGIAYDADVQRAMDELKQIGASLREDPAFKDLILNDIEIWGVDAVDGSTVTLVGQISCRDTGRLSVQRELNRRILERFRKAGIEIANPRVNLLLNKAGNVNGVNKVS